MKTLYLDCGMGAAGDMLSGALLELLPDGNAFLEEFNALGLPGVHVARESSVKCGVTGTHISVTVHGEEEESLDGHDHGHTHDHSLAHSHDGHAHEHSHHHSGLHEVEHIVAGHLNIPERVKENILEVYRLIAQAESHVHGVPVTEIHFHEVGTLDAIADVTMVCMLLDRLSPDQIISSPVHVGSGQVRCAHGILPVPAPAAAYILRDVPIYSGEILGELCTPTGAALLKHFAARFDGMPLMRVQKIGYGMGKKDFPAANCVRALWGESGERRDAVVELSCNVDDMTAEEIGFAMERLLEEGALDVYTVPIGMKKCRPGTLIRVMCRAEEKEAVAALMFRHTSTLGIRETDARRYVLERKLVTDETPYGPVRRKEASGYGAARSKYEYEDVAAIARARGISIREVLEGLK